MSTESWPSARAARETGIRLPDALIGATATKHGLGLVTGPNATSASSASSDCAPCADASAGRGAGGEAFGPGASDGRRHVPLAVGGSPAWLPPQAHEFAQSASRPARNRGG